MTSIVTRHVTLKEATILLTSLPISPHFFRGLLRSCFWCVWDLSYTFVL